MSALSEVAAFLTQNPGIWSAKTLKKESGIRAVEGTIGRALRELADRPNSGFKRLQVGVYEVGGGRLTVTPPPPPAAVSAQIMKAIQDAVQAQVPAANEASAAKNPGKRTFTPEEIQEAFRLYAQGTTERQVASKFNVGDATAHRLRTRWIEAGKPGTVHEQWAVYYGGPDPDNCAGFNTYDDEAEAGETLQWVRDGGLARRTVTESVWEVQ